MLRTVRRTPLYHCKNKTVTKKGGAGSLNLGLKGFKPVICGDSIALHQIVGTILGVPKPWNKKPHTTACLSRTSRARRKHRISHGVQEGFENRIKKCCCLTPRTSIFTFISTRHINP
jgi:hypothetical protein